MHQTNDPLLQPSLTVDKHEAIYSPRATFLISFFGGPAAALLIMGMNSRLLGRLKQDAPLYAVLALVMVGTFWALVDPTLGGSALTSPRHVRTAVRIIGFLLWGVLYLRFRAMFRAAELTGDFRSPWIAGILCVIVATGLQLGLLAGLRALAGTP